MLSDDLRNLFDRARKRLTDFVKRQLWKLYFSVRWSYAGRIGYTMFMSNNPAPATFDHITRNFRLVLGSKVQASPMIYD